MVLQRNLLMLALLTTAGITGMWLTGATTTDPQTPTAAVADPTPPLAVEPEIPEDTHETATPESDGNDQTPPTGADARQAAQGGEIAAPGRHLENFNLRVAGDTGSGLHEEWTIPVDAASFDTLEVLVTIEDAGEIIDWAIQCVEAILRDAQGNEVARGTAQEQDGLLFTQDETVTVLEFRFADGDEAREEAIGNWTLELHANDSNLAYNVAADVLYEHTG